MRTLTLIAVVVAAVVASSATAGTRTCVSSASLSTSLSPVVYATNDFSTMIQSARSFEQRREYDMVSASVGAPVPPDPLPVPCDPSIFGRRGAATTTLLHLYRFDLALAAFPDSSPATASQWVTVFREALLANTYSARVARAIALPTLLLRMLAADRARILALRGPSR